jgi:mannose-6-phosphate isomerase-like protein (cupin superfamily)
VVQPDPITLNPHDGVTIPKGVMHKPRAHGRTVVLMVEPAGVVPTGD